MKSYQYTCVFLSQILISFKHYIDYILLINSILYLGVLTITNIVLELYLDIVHIVCTSKVYIPPGTLIGRGSSNISSILVQVCMFLSTALSATHGLSHKDVLYCTVSLSTDISSGKKIINTLLTSLKKLPPKCQKMSVHVSLKTWKIMLRIRIECILHMLVI